MSTAIGFECGGGAVLAVDRGLVQDGAVVSADCDRLWTFDDGRIGLAAVGARDSAGRDRDDPDAVKRSFDAAVREYRTDRCSPTVEAATQLAADVADEVVADLILAARDADGVARVRGVRADGSVVDAPSVAVGSGTAVALGGLDGLDSDVGPAAAAEAVRDVVATVGRRDTETAETADAWWLADD